MFVFTLLVVSACGDAAVTRDTGSDPDTELHFADTGETLDTQDTGMAGTDTGSDTDSRPTDTVDTGVGPSGLLGLLSDTDADLRFAGSQGDAEAGYDLAVGDLDGDGLADLVAVAPDFAATGTAGSAWLVPGGTTASWDLDWFEDSLTGSEEDPLAEGWTYSDLDGDGLADLCVGGVGAVGVLYGSGITGTVVESALDARIEGSGEHGGGLGVDLRCDTDFSGDGVDDVLIGAPYDSLDGSTTGAALVFFGGPR